MTDDDPELDVAPPSEPPAPEPPEAPAPAPRPRLSRRWLLAIAAFAAAGIIAGDLFLISTSKTPSTAKLAPSGVAPVESAAKESDDQLPSLSKAEPAPGDSDDTEAPEQPEKPKRARARIGTVQEAAARSCSTSSVDGLSRQIIAQARCIDANAFVAVPARKNLVTASNVFLYLEGSAKKRLVQVLDTHRDKTMTVNSALRTVAQQYLLWRWSTNKRCGIQLATRPGESNHETGLALDIAEASKWRPVLEAQDFRWLGSIDEVHFDYKGSNASSSNNIDVIGFQQLWNRNHPDDLINENGRYDEATEQRLKKTPANGFAIGAHCDKKR